MTKQNGVVSLVEWILISAGVGLLLGFGLLHLVLWKWPGTLTYQWDVVTSVVSALAFAAVAITLHHQREDSTEYTRRQQQLAEGTVIAARINGITVLLERKIAQYEYTTNLLNHAISAGAAEATVNHLKGVQSELDIDVESLEKEVAGLLVRLRNQDVEGPQS